jgi:DNA repair ATPase RecN
LDYIAKAVHDAIVDEINPQLPPLIHSHLRKICEEEGLELDPAEIHRIAARVGDLVPAARDFNKLQREVAALAQEVKTLNDSMLKFATAKATDDESTTPSATTSQRQLSRHAEHLANLESRLKTLERNK